MKLKGKWKKLGSGVYEASNGTRIHINGYITPVGCKMISMNTISRMWIFSHACSMFGGNRKRGLMLIAEQL